MASKLLAPGEVWIDGAICILVVCVCTTLPDSGVRTIEIVLDGGDCYLHGYHVGDFTDDGFARLPSAAP